MGIDAICIRPRCDYSHTPKPDGHFVGHRQTEKIKLSNDREMAQSERNSHSKSEVGK